MAHVHPLSYIHPGAELAEDVMVGPFCYVDDQAVLGPGTRLESHVTIGKWTRLGSRNVVAQGAVLGGAPQDKKYHGEPTYLNIGDDNVFREYVTIHRATGEGQATTVGDRCYLMAFVHLGHNVTLHSDVTIANSVGVAGHCTIEDMANIGGMTGLHQWVRVGRIAFIGGMSRIVRDVPPFCMVEGLDQTVRDINAVGLRRIGVTSESRLAIHKAVKLLFKSQLGLTNAIETVRREVKPVAEVEELIRFMERLFQGKNGRGDQP